MWAERNRVRPRRDEEPKPSRWWRSRWSVALPASKARNRFLGLGFGGRPQRGGQQPARISPSQSPARQSGNERWLARVPGAGAARFSAYRHALARRSGGRSSTLSLGAYYPVQPEALPAGHAPQSRTATPPTLRGRIQLPAQPPHYGDQSISPTRAGLSHNQHYHLQGVDHRSGSSLIFIKHYYRFIYHDCLESMAWAENVRKSLKYKLVIAIQFISKIVTSDNFRQLFADGRPETSLPAVSGY